MTRNNKGFTLIEIIVIIVVGGIVAAMLVPFMGSALTKSHEPLVNLEKAASVSSDMAKLVADFRGTDSKCEDIIEHDFTLNESELIPPTPHICCFDDSNVLQCSSSGDPENCAVPVYMVEVRLRHKGNPGETATFLFPCNN